MNNSAAKVGEIFREAGTAFSKLSEMTMALQPIEESSPGGKWTEEEIDMLRGCVNRFAVELNKISQHIKNRTMNHLRRLLEMDSGEIQDISSSPPRPAPPQIQPAPESQIRTTLKKKAFEDAGIPVRQVSSTVTSYTPQAPHVAPAPLSVINRQTVLGQNAEVTLNMLNASESEDVDGLSGEVKLEFDSANDEAAT